jgi:hypothetical protein
VDLDFFWRGAGSVPNADEELSRLCEWFWIEAAKKGLLEDGKNKIEFNRKGRPSPYYRMAMGLPQKDAAELWPAFRYPQHLGASAEGDRAVLRF